MTVVDVIDLTVSPPPSAVIIIDGDDEEAADTVAHGQDSKDKKRRKQRRRDERDRRERRNQEKEDQRSTGSWKHDKFLEEEEYYLGEKRKRVDNARVTRTPKRRERSLSPMFLVDTSAGSLFQAPSQAAHAPTEPVPVEPALEAPAESLDGPPIESPKEPLLEAPERLGHPDRVIFVDN